ncbi:hypothetical protein CERZMDRAFT_83297 [Cercospora zeae-maydis SCOH1-5]|uniref:Uncharacterized protein n=1 Tax=Cercospora zeae-maydis SCOH1-5 TaxID=717836 RepID=A0A6A6FKW1_9PEZI|nr:hypothetical protein CERZMDRAFT_83297 [Cercospora zeae-maydis SCOH1-5]
MPHTTTVTSTVKVTREATSTVSATSAATTDASTTYIMPTFAIANENGKYLGDGVVKSTRSEVGFDDESGALLFELKEKSVLVSENVGSSDGNPEVYLTPQGDPLFPNYKPLTRSTSYEATYSTCPLICQYSSSADRNLVAPPSSYRLGRPPRWIGERNEEKDLTATYKTYAVARGAGGNRGGLGGRGGSSLGSKRRMRLR